MENERKVQEKINEALKKINEALIVIEQAKKEILSIEFYLDLGNDY